MGIFCKRRRKHLTPILLAAWVFAIIMSVAHACGLDEGFVYAGPCSTVDSTAQGVSHDHNVPPGCKEFCADDSPLLAKLKIVQDQPAGQAFLTPAVVGESFRTAASLVPSLLASPRPGVAVNIRFARLSL